MTTLNIATDIPSQINTLEKLAVWACMSLAAANQNVMAIEGVGYSERSAQAATFFVAADNKWRFLGRVSIHMAPDFLAGGAKTWTFAQDLSNTPIPQTYKLN